MGSFNDLIINCWFSCLNRSQHKDTIVNGQDLDIGAVTAVARYGASATIDAAVLERATRAVDLLQDTLERGVVVYGVNTGFGGSAHTRTTKVGNLQRELIRMLNYGILPDPGSADQGRTWLVNGSTSAFPEAIPLSNPDASLCMPDAWVRASMLIRLNSLVKGASGVQRSTLINLNQLLDKDIVPHVPLRGSISASGDLSPLSYIAGAMMGNKSAKVWTGSRAPGKRRLVSASQALDDEGIEPISLGPKEGLAIVNGTAVSAGVAALATYETAMQATLAQLLTAMSVEALKGTEESFDPFFAQVRQHPGQGESARNILHFLKGSRLTEQQDTLGDGKLRQDRYSTRTASQWIGPCLEDIELASQQVTVELNSVTDNPLINTETEQILHGGNFQAKAVTNAMEKLRQACQSLGRMTFAQCTELINPATNFGLPPNLVIDNPSESFLWKGTDIMVAALQSELGFLANPVGSHTQTAEMSNQALNSLALISARYTFNALDVLNQMAAAHLVALCQALDLRAIHIQLLEQLKPKLHALTSERFERFLSDESSHELRRELWNEFQDNLDKNCTLDIEDRFRAAVKSCQPTIFAFMPEEPVMAGEMTQELRKWTEGLTDFATKSFNAVVDRYCTDGDATPYLGRGSKRMYCYIRRKLGIPFETRRRGHGNENDRKLVHEPTDLPTIGEYNSKVYRSICSGELYAEVAAAVADVEASENTKKRKATCNDSELIS